MAATSPRQRLWLIVFGVRTYQALVLDYRLDPWLPLVLLNVSSYLIAAIMLFVVHRYLGFRRFWLERTVLGYTVAITVLLALLSDQAPRVGPLFMGGSFLVGFYVTWIALAAAWKTRRADELVLAGGVVIQLAFALNDGLLYLSVLPHQDWYLMQYGSGGLALILAWLLTSRFTQALGVAEAARSELARQVEEKRRELEAGYRRLHELERVQAVAAERERIMRDLHDGLGGQLVSALALSQRGATPQPAISQTLREALDDLRMVIDSLDPVEGDVLALLGSVRSRFESRLAQHGVRFEWQVAEIPALPDFGPDKALHVLRIVQEAITNVLKHAGARIVTVRTGVAPAGENGTASVFVEIADDGAGIGAGGAGGRGLRNMRERAELVGGNLDVASRTSGTTVRLLLPLGEAPETAPVSHVRGIAMAREAADDGPHRTKYNTGRSP